MFSLRTLAKDRFALVTLSLFIFLTVWWAALFISGSRGGFDNLFFGAVYGTTMSLLGGGIGFKIATRWGGKRSLMGKALMFFGFGLLAQFFGQTAFSYYNIVRGVEIPYPSIADIGYFGNIPLYLAGVILIGKAAGVEVNLRSFRSQLQAIIIPLAMILTSYALLLKNYAFTGTPWLTMLLDFGYPLGQATYVSFAILIFSLSRGILGGLMKDKIIFLVFALTAQYLADFNFLYQNVHGTWYNGGYGDYMYLIAYGLMTLALLQFRMTHVRASLEDD